jgi:hypothetical protein
MELEKLQKLFLKVIRLFTLEKIFSFITFLSDFFAAIAIRVNSDFSNKTINLILKNPSLILVISFVIFILIIFNLFYIVLHLYPKYFYRSIGYFHKHISKSCITIIIFYIIFLISFSYLLHSFYNENYNLEGRILFPQADELGLGPIRFDRYSSNGNVHFSFYDGTPINGHKDYVKITLKVNTPSDDDNAGWIVFLQRGSDINRFTHLHFLIKGEKGGEKIGIKAKDCNGTENCLPLDYYLPKGQITKDWQPVDIPFKHFGNVEFSLFDNFNFYTKGSMAIIIPKGSTPRTIPQTFYVCKFQFT